MGGIGVTWRIRIAASFSSSILVGGHGGNLETLQTTSDSELLKAIGSDSQDGHHGTTSDSELLKAIGSDSQDGHHGTM